jgi:hypothetical protein
MLPEPEDPWGGDQIRKIVAVYLLTTTGVNR